MATVTTTFACPVCCGGGECIGMQPCVEPCGACRWALLLLNCNGIPDDDFDVYWNGELVASVPESDPDPECGLGPCRGTLILPTSFFPSTFAAELFECWCCGGLTPPVIAYDYADALDTVLADNTFEIVSTTVGYQPCGNYGTMSAFRICGGQLCGVIQAGYLGGQILDVPSACTTA